MNKIICDVCGTSYPETATQCPICGCVRPGEVHTVAGDTNDQPSVTEAGNYTYVKGGRFSKSNVRKRMRSEQNNGSESNAGKTENSESGSKKDLGLMIAVIALLLAIIAVVIYIVVNFFMPGNTNKPDAVDQTTTEQTTTVEETTTEPTELEIPCEELLLDALQVQLEAVDASWLLNVHALPEDTTDEILFESSDPDVATVSAEGLVTAVADGTADIRITCGSVEIVCEIICNIPEETEPSTAPDVELELNRDDFSLFFVGDSWNVYSGDIDPKLITWTSKNESVVTVTDGVVEAVGPGDTTIYGEYNGVKVSCAVHCKFTAQPTQPENDDKLSETEGDCKISHTDVMLLLDVADRKSFVLTLTDANGNPVNVTWKSDDSYCTINGNVITGVSTGITNVYTTYNGHTYSCIVRVLIR